MKKFISLILVCVFMPVSISVRANESTVQELKKYEIIKGDPDGNFRLEDELTRAEAVTLMVRLYGFEPESSEAIGACEFLDMENHWARNAAIIAENLEITAYAENKSFNPDEKISAQELLKMVVCLLGYKEVAQKKAPDYIGYIMQASQMGITKDVALITTKPISRAQTVKILCNSLDIPIMVQTSFGETNEYTIMNGKNKNEYRSLRTILEKN